MGELLKQIRHFSDNAESTLLLEFKSEVNKILQHQVPTTIIGSFFQTQRVGVGQRVAD